MNTNSLVEPITRPIELQSQPPFLLYRNQRSAISGFWFYCRDDCVRIHALLEKLIKKASSSKGGDPAHPHSQQGQGRSMTNANVISNGIATEKKPSDVDIFSMLSKAQAEFNSSSIGTGLEQQMLDMKINQSQQQQQHQQPSAPPPPQQQQQQQPLMKQLSMTMTMPVITSPNVVSFFAAAQQPNGAIPILADGGGGGAPRSFIAGVPHHRPTMVQPPVQTLDEIEKQHRVASVSPKVAVEPKLLNNLLNSSIQQQQQQQQPQQSPPALPPVQSSNNITQPIKLLQPTPSQSTTTAPKLLAPTVFQASNVEEKTSATISQQPPQQQHLQQFRPEPLTHNQLIQALNYLLENDPDFIRKIHEAYIKSFNKILH